MKINSRKLLVFSYALSGKPVLYLHLTYLWPELSAGGRRGLIAHLLKQRLISVNYKGKQAQFSLSPIGKSWVEEEYFASDTQVGNGAMVLIYPEIPPNDPKLMALKKVLKGELSELSPKTYLCATNISDELLTQIKKRYFSIAAVVTLESWQCGDPNQFFNYYLQKKSSSDLLSGVSNQIMELTEKKITFSNANHQSKLEIYSLLDRLFEIVEQKWQLDESSNTKSPSARELLGLFSRLFTA